MIKMDEINNIIKENTKLKTISSKDISDGHHTFWELYKNRIILFCILCNLFPDISCKSRKHYDEENDPMFSCDFIARINTPEWIANISYKITILGFIWCYITGKSP